MRIPKINSIHFGGIWIGISILIGLIVPSVIWLCFHVFFLWLSIIGGALFIGFLIVFWIEMKQDNGKVPYYEHTLAEQIPFDPGLQEAFIRSSICTGEKIACFRRKDDRSVVEVMVIRTPEDMERFLRIYGLKDVKTEY